MEVRTKQLRRCDLVVAKGRIDTDTVGTLTEAFAAIKEAGRHKIILNMQEVTYISSSGLGQLIETQKICKKNGGSLVLAHVPQRIKEALELAGLTPLFKQFEDEIEAVDSF